HRAGSRFFALGAGHMFRIDPRQAAIDHMERGGESLGQGLSPQAEAIASRPVERGYSHAIIVGVAQALEAAMLLALGVGLFIAYIGTAEAVFYLPLTAGAVLAANIAFNVARTHRIQAYRTVVKQTVWVLAGWLAVLLLLFAGMVLFK